MPPNWNVPTNTDYTMVIGFGMYRIGSLVEFDWCAISCLRELKKLGPITIMLNCDPETVSTDYDKNPEGIISSIGGQLPNNICMDLYRQQLVGTSPGNGAENRLKFTRMLYRKWILQLLWKELTDLKSPSAFCNDVGYPCNTDRVWCEHRMLSGAAINVAQDMKEYNDQDMKARKSIWMQHSMWAKNIWL